MAPSGGHRHQAHLEGVCLNLHVENTSVDLLYGDMTAFTNSIRTVQEARLFEIYNLACLCRFGALPES